MSENVELLRRLDAWHEGVNPGPLIRWAAAHLRGCVASDERPCSCGSTERLELCQGDQCVNVCAECGSDEP